MQTIIMLASALLMIIQVVATTASAADVEDGIVRGSEMSRDMAGVKPNIVVLFADVRKRLYSIPCKGVACFFSSDFDFAALVYELVHIFFFGVFVDCFFFHSCLDFSLPSPARTLTPFTFLE